MSSIEISSNARSPNSRRPTSSRCSRVVTHASLLNFVQEGTDPCVAACEKGDRPLIRRVRERGLAPELRQKRRTAPIPPYMSSWLATTGSPWPPAQSFAQACQRLILALALDALHHVPGRAHHVLGRRGLDIELEPPGDAATHAARELVLHPRDGLLRRADQDAVQRALPEAPLAELPHA